MTDKVKNVNKKYFPRNSRWMGQKVLFLSFLFGKEYYWMQDGDGTIYLAYVGKNGEPEFI